MYIRRTYTKKGEDDCSLLAACSFCLSFLNSSPFSWLIRLTLIIRTPSCFLTDNINIISLSLSLSRRVCVLCLVKKRYFIAAHRQGIKTMYSYYYYTTFRVHISVDLDAADAAATATALLPSCCMQPIITFSVSLFLFFLSKNVEIPK